MPQNPFLLRQLEIEGELPLESLIVGKFPFADIRRYGGSFEAAITDIGYTQLKTLVVSTQVYLKSDVTIPSNINVQVFRGGRIYLGNYDFACDGPFQAPLAKVFYETGTGKVIRLFVEKTYPEWWENNTIPGTTDMTAGSQAAIDVAGSKIPVSFLDRVYMVSGLTVGTAAWIEGNNGTTIKLIAGSNNHVFNTSADVTTRLLFKNLTIDGNRANQTTAGNGINLAGGTHVLWTKLERVYISECYNYGLYIDNANIVSMKDGWLNSCRYGAYILDSEEVNFIGVNIETNDTYGLKYDVSDNATGRIGDCWFEAGITTPTDYIIINTPGIKVDSCRLAMGNGVDNGPTHAGINVLTGRTNCMIIANTALGALHPTATNFIVFDSGSKNNMSIGNRGGSGGTAGGGTTDEDGRNYILEQNVSGPTYGIQQAGRVVGTVLSLDDTGTPSVRDGHFFKTGGETAITDFDDGLDGQEIVIVARHAVTITDGATLHLSGGADFPMAITDTLTLVRDYNKWVEQSRGDNT